MKVIKLMLIGAIFTTSCLEVFSQNTKDGKDEWQEVSDSMLARLKRDYSFSCEANNKGEYKKIISRPATGKVFDKYFAFALTDKDNLAIGTVAGLDISNNETKLNLNISNYISSGWLLSVGAALPVKDKTGNFFTNNKVSTGINGTIKISRRMNPRLFYFASNCLAFEPQRKALQNQQLTTFNKAYYDYLVAKKRLDEMDASNSECDSLKNLSDAAKIKACAELTTERLTLQQIIGKYPDKAAKEQLLNSLLDSLVAFESKKAPLNLVQFWWWSFSAGYSSESYQLFDKTRIKPDAPVYDKSHNRFKFGIEFSHFFDFQESFKKTRLYGRTGFLTLSANFEIDNNIKSMKALATPITLITENNDTLNSSTESDKKIIYDASSLQYEKFGSLVTNIRYLAYYGKSKKIGFDLFGNMVFNKNIAGPLINIGVGLVYNVKNAEEGKPKVSFELFYKLNDMTNRLPSSKGIVIERNEIGITTVIPFSKLVL